MKKLLIAALFALALTTTAFASPAANAKAMSHFATAFKGAKNIKWTSTDNFDRATFTLNNEQIDVFYDAFGEVLGTSKVMAYNKLPKRALEVLTTKYTFPEFQLKDCIEFTNANNEKNYYISFDAKNEQVIVEVSLYGTVSLMSKTKK